MTYNTDMANTAKKYLSILREPDARPNNYLDKDKRLRSKTLKKWAFFNLCLNLGIIASNVMAGVLLDTKSSYPSIIIIVLTVCWIGLFGLAHVVFEPLEKRERRAAAEYVLQRCRTDNVDLSELKGWLSEQMPTHDLITELIAAGIKPLEK